MNSTFFKCLAFGSLAFLAAACAKEQQTAGDGQTAGVSFTVAAPVSFDTKAIADGKTATKLLYQVFDASGDPIPSLGVQTATLTPASGGGSSAVVEFRLVKGETYNFIFWAQTQEDGYYTVDATDGLKKITANYTDKSANDENFDAFFATVKDREITGAISETITLSRPFAQLNIASGDTGISAGETSVAIDFTGAKSAITIKQIPTVFAPLGDELSGTADVTFAEAAVPTGTLTVGGIAYKYLSMNYIFASAAGDVCDFDATFTVDGSTVNTTMTNTPIRRNCRTNIVGKVLTSKLETNVIVDPATDEDESLDGYKDNGYATSIPAGPEDMTVSTIDVTAANAQYVLDGAYGSIDGKTINFTESITDQVLVLGRPNKFSGSNTKYMVGGYTSDAAGWQEFASADALVEYLSENSATCYYTRSIGDVKFTAADGVVIAGVKVGSGHVYGTATSPVYDYVLDNGNWEYSTTSYYCLYTIGNLSFEGVTFLKNASFTNTSETSSIESLSFKDCKFLAFTTAEASNGKGGQRIYIRSDVSSYVNLFKKLVVDNCEFITSYQGIYAQFVHDLTVTNCKFTNTGHNAISLQPGSATPEYGNIVITGNTFSNIGDRIIRFGRVASIDSITITGNVSTNSGDESSQLMKTEPIPASGFRYDISDNTNDGVAWVDASTEDTTAGTKTLIYTAN